MNLYFNRMGETLWVLCWLLLHSTTFANLCNEKCSCVDRTGDCSNLGLISLFNDTLWNNTKEITIMKFNDNNLKHINLFPQLPLEYLSFTNNSISSIDDGSFKLLPNLTLLDLSQNLLRSDELRPDIFKGLYSPGAYEPLRKLKTLRLSNNQLHTLHQDLFEHLPKLESLSIDGNPFKFIDKPTVIAISSIQNLKTLDLSNTNIKDLPEHMLHSPRYLSVLNLAYNQFQMVPQELENSHELKLLILDHNPIQKLEKFPTLPFLEEIRINYMPKLKTIGSGALSNLTNLKILMITNNFQLTEISANALSRIPEDGSEGRVWPIVKRLYLADNHLGYLEHNLIGKWDLVEVVDLRGNPWVCDCKNQWMVSVLMPIIKKSSTHQNLSIICYEPIEMRGSSMQELNEKNYRMRCLDAYGHQPEKDGALLLGICIGLFLAIPVTMAALIVYKRRNFKPANKHFARAFYKPADSDQFFVHS